MDPEQKGTLKKWRKQLLNKRITLCYYFPSFFSLSFFPSDLNRSTAGT
jgi:hypothetical protein